MSADQLDISDLCRAREIAEQVARKAGRLDLRDDVESAATFQLVRCAENYNPDKAGPGGWPAYRDTCVRQGARNEIQRLVGRAKPGSAAWAISHPVSLDVLLEAGYEPAAA